MAPPPDADKVEEVMRFVNNQLDELEAAYERYRRENNKENRDAVYLEMGVIDRKLEEINRRVWNRDAKTHLERDWQTEDGEWVRRMNQRDIISWHAGIEDRRLELIDDIDGYDGAPGPIWTGSLRAEHPF